MEIADLKSLGPKSQQLLADAGITTVDELYAIGAVAAYLKVKAYWPRTSLNMLWALESAVTGIPWQEVARLHRTNLLSAVEAAQRE
ncbi:MAG: TfoX/Sxy family protein [Gammaproteobacteria bacterium]|jgi:DNA transformation protein|nr:TfoX/Sxy family protein [Gammaproteobacteria bacterium]